MQYGPDFKYFREAGIFYSTEGRLPAANEGPASLPFYLPFAYRFLAPLGWANHRITGAVWSTVNLVILAAIVVWLGRTVRGFKPSRWPVHQMIPVLLVFAWLVTLAYWNQLTAWVLGGVLLSYVLLTNGWRTAAGVVLGLVTLLKLMPGLLFLWLVCKRAWRTIASGLITIVIVGPALDLSTLGYRESVAYYRIWVEEALVKGNASYMIRNDYESDFRNQGLGVVLLHLLHPANCAARIWNDPTISVPKRVWTINLTDLDRETIVWIHRLLTTAGLLAFIAVCRRSLRSLSPEAARFEISGALACILLFSPLVRLYHLVLLLPGVSLITNTPPDDLRIMPRRRLYLVLLWGYVALYLVSSADFVLFTITRKDPMPLPGEAAGSGLLAAAIVAVLCFWRSYQIEKSTDQSVVTPVSSD
jgi:hypothetical protein